MLFALTRVKEETQYDEMELAIVEADSELQARQLVSEAAGEEGPQPWLDPYRSTCEERVNTGDGIILRLYKS